MEASFSLASRNEQAIDRPEKQCIQKPKGPSGRSGLYIVKHALPAVPISYSFLNPWLPLVNVQ